MKRTALGAAITATVMLTACAALAGRASGATTLTAATTTAPAGVQGIDISSWQSSINWKIVKADGYKFVYIKATEADYYTSPDFASQYAGARKAGIVAGAYTFANPDGSGGTAQQQADYFVEHGGSYKAGTLPGVLDIEDDPYSTNKCYGLSSTAMVKWISAFVTEYHKKTGWWPVINTFAEWWKACTSDTTDFAAHDPLWINNHESTAGTPLGGWKTYTVWQWAETGTYNCDQDVIPATLYKKLLA